MPQNGINYAGVMALASAMRHNPELRVLNFNDNTFTKKGTLAMAQVRPPFVHTSPYKILINLKIDHLWLMLQFLWLGEGECGPVVCDRQHMKAKNVSYVEL